MTTTQRLESCISELADVMAEVIPGNYKAIRRKLAPLVKQAYKQANANSGEFYGRGDVRGEWHVQYTAPTGLFSVFDRSQRWGERLASVYAFE